MNEGASMMNPKMGYKPGISLLSGSSIGARTRPVSAYPSKTVGNAIKSYDKR